MIKISIPTFAYPPGQFSQLLQILFTKIRNEQNASIQFDIDENDEQYIFEKFYIYYQFLVIVLFSKNLSHVKILNKNGVSISKEKLCSLSITKLNLQEELYSLTFEPALSYDSPRSKIEDLRKQFFSDRGDEKEYGGLSFLISNFDHIAALRKTSYFYNNTGTLRLKSEIISWVTKVFKYNKLNIREGIYRNETHNDIAIVLKELFDNTEEWGRSNYNDTIEYNPNVRSCFINILMDRRVQHLSSRKDDPVIDYVTTLVNSNPEDLYIPKWQSELYSHSKVGLCEISILDTGPGMARRWLGKDYSDLTKEEEEKAVINCFNKYVTSDSTARYQVRGRGLNNVIKVIGNSGYLIVRTGHVSLFRNFFDEKLSKYESDGFGLTFKTDYKGLVEGTSITILYPFLYQQ